MQEDGSSQPVEQIKKFQFFSAEPIQDKPLGSDPQAATLNDIDISDACCIGTRLYFSSIRKKIIYIYESSSIQGFFQVYTEQIHFMKATTEQKDGLLITFGVDAENQLKSSYVKFWDPNTPNFQQLKPKKQILIGKLGQPLQSFLCFSVSKDLTAMAFGLQDGTVLYYKSKNLLTQDITDRPIQADSEPIRSLLFSRVESNLHLYVTTDSSALCYQNMQNRKRLGVAGGTLFDLSAKGTLVGSPKDDNASIYEFDDSRKIQSWNLEGEKLELKFFKNHYLLLLISPKMAEGKELQQADTATMFVVFDLLNQYIAYQEKYQKIQRFIPAGDFIYLITLNSKGEKILTKLHEKENTYKIEMFFKKNFFDVMYRFASNQSNDKSLLAEISRLHGDNLYEKHDFTGAIKQYINTAGHLEPSYVIGKFLDVSHVDYLIQYLAALHKEKLADKNHTALLLNCYVKQKQINKLEDFLKESSFDSDLFDIETAIRECRALDYKDLAMKLAESRKQNEQYLRILIDDKYDYLKAIQYIRFKIELDDKVRYLKEFGQTLMKFEPYACLDVIQNLVLLSGIAATMRKRHDPVDGALKQINAEEQGICKYFQLSEAEIEKLTTVTFCKPDEFLHLFVVNNEQLENYLVFLIQKCKNLPNEKAIFHRFFEFYLEKYQQYHKANFETLKYRKETDQDLAKKEQVIMDLLEDAENEKKYDKNHLLVLFKMYTFVPGIIFMLKKLQMREELLNFYITQRDNDKIIQLCRENGEKESNLWYSIQNIPHYNRIQALKYFSKPDNQSEERIEEVLKHIINLQTLSPLLILNILSHNKNVDFKLVKTYFILKIKEDRHKIEEDQKLVKDKMKRATDTRGEYKKLKTQAKVFQATKCSTCENQLTLPSLHFLCGHSYHENCLHSDKPIRECTKCSFDSNRLLERKQQFDAAVSDIQTFKEKLHQSRDKFDVVCEYLGRGIIKNNPEDTLTQQ